MHEVGCTSFQCGVMTRVFFNDNEKYFQNEKYVFVKKLKHVLDQLISNNILWLNIISLVDF